MSKFLIRWGVQGADIEEATLEFDNIDFAWAEAERRALQLGSPETVGYVAAPLETNPVAVYPISLEQREDAWRYRGEDDRP